MRSRQSLNSFSPASLLQASRWSADLTAEEQDRVLGSIRIQQVREGDYVCRRGEPAPGT